MHMKLCLEIHSISITRSNYENNQWWLLCKIKVESVWTLTLFVMIVMGNNNNGKWSKLAIPVLGLYWPSKCPDVKEKGKYPFF